MTPPVNLVSQTWQRPLVPPEQLPKTADVVIIGGGIVGVSAAWFLAKRGLRVVLCEKGHIAGQQSGRNWGWVRAMLRHSREMPMMLDSMRIWDSLAEELGEDVGFRRSGCYVMARTERFLEQAAQWLPTAREFGLDTTVIDGHQLAQRVNGKPDQWVGALCLSLIHI